jgi:uroporphyrinogen decarboxylase
LRKVAETYEEMGFATKTVAPYGGLNDQYAWLRGLDKFMIDLYTNTRVLGAIIDRLTKLWMNALDILLDELGDVVQMICLGEDLGTQRGLLFSPENFRKHIKPSYEKMCARIHSRTNAKIYIHSCGAIEPLIGDLIDVGIDVLNPVQPRAAGMDSTALKDKYGDRLSFDGGVDTQETLPLGNTKDVEDEVVKRLQAFGPGGGYICAPSHNILGDVPPENIVRMYETAINRGSYPLPH